MVWQDRRGDNWDIYGYDLASGKELAICTAPRDQTQPSVYGNRVAWTDERNDRLEIYWTSVPGIAAAPAAPTAAAPLRPGDARLAALPGIKVVVSGKLVETDQPPVMEGGRVLLPLRHVAEALGAEVGWKQDTQEVSFRKGTVLVTMKIGEALATVNGKVASLDAPAKLVNGCTLAPLRFVAESLGASVDWDPASQTAFLLPSS